MRSIQVNYPGCEDAVLTGYLLDCAIPFGQEDKRPAVIVCPGGGYIYCSDAEGEPVALRYAARGYHSFVLRYSTGKNAAGFAPLKQLSWAIGLLRENAQDWKIDPNRIIVCGFSAGGHLALASGLLAEEKPDAMILGYPATSAPNMPGMDFMLRFLSGKESPTDADAEYYDLVPQITKDAPPVFMMATAEDALTPYGALAVAKKYSDLGMDYELHIFQHGPHGYSLADQTSAAGSSRYLNPEFAQWFDLSIAWIQKTLGKPEFVEKSNSKMAKYLMEMGITLRGFQGE